MVDMNNIYKGMSVELADGSKEDVYSCKRYGRSFLVEFTNQEKHLYDVTGYCETEEKRIVSVINDSDLVAHPDHYATTIPGIECIDITKHMNFCRGSAMKYLWRAGHKNADKEIEDLEKAIQFIKFEISRLKGE